MTKQNKNKLSKIKQKISKMLKDNSEYFFLEVNENGDKYAYYMSTDHIRSVLNNDQDESWSSDYAIITEEDLNNECHLDSYEAPFLHIVKVK